MRDNKKEDEDVLGSNLELPRSQRKYGIIERYEGFIDAEEPWGTFLPRTDLTLA